MNQIDYTNQSNNLLALEAEKFANSNRTFNQQSNKFSDACFYKQQLNLATKPLEYCVNSLNNISSTNNPKVAFTAIGNAAQQNIANVFDRPIPSHLNRTSPTYHFNYNTSPNLHLESNINVFDTDTDLFLKTGLELRSKNNKADLSQKQFAVYGDIYQDEIAYLYQNAGQHNKNNLPNKYNNIPGLQNYYPGQEQNGIGVINFEHGRNWFVDTYGLMQTVADGAYKNNYEAAKEFKIIK